MSLISIHHRHEGQLFRVFNAKVAANANAAWVSQALLSPQDEEQSWFRAAYVAAHPDRAVSPLNTGDVVEIDREEFFKVVKNDQSRYVCEQLAYMGEYDEENEYIG